MRARNFFRSVEFGHKAFIQYLVYKRRFARTGYAGYTHKLAERDFGIYIFEIVFACADYFQAFSVAFSALCGNWNLLATAEILPGYRLLAVHYIFRRACTDYISAVDTRTRTDIDNVVRRAHRVLVVLDNYKRVADIPEVAKSIQKLFVVALMQTYTRLVENIQNSDKRRADLSCKAYSLAFAAGEARRRAGKGQITEADAAQKCQSVLYLLDYKLRYHLLAVGQGERIKKFYSFDNRFICKFIDIYSADGYAQRLFSEPCAVAFGTFYR